MPKNFPPRNGWLRRDPIQPRKGYRGSSSTRVLQSIRRMVLTTSFAGSKPTRSASGEGCSEYEVSTLAKPAMERRTSGRRLATLLSAGGIFVQRERGDWNETTRCSPPKDHKVTQPDGPATISEESDWAQSIFTAFARESVARRRGLGIHMRWFA